MPADSAGTVEKKSQQMVVLWQLKNNLQMALWQFIKQPTDGAVIVDNNWRWIKPTGATFDCLTPQMMLNNDVVVVGLIADGWDGIVCGCAVCLH